MDQVTPEARPAPELPRTERPSGGYSGRSYDRRGDFDQRDGGEQRGGRDAGRGGGRRRYAPRRKVCAFCVDHVKIIDYKQAEMLRRFLTDRGKIKARRKTGTCAKHQRRLALAIKRARHIALLPFTGDQSR